MRPPIYFDESSLRVKNASVAENARSTALPTYYIGSTINPHYSLKPTASMKSTRLYNRLDRLYEAGTENSSLKEVRSEKAIFDARVRQHL